MIHFMPALYGNEARAPDELGDRRAVVLLATLAAVALTARLGVWQLDRARQKQALQDSLSRAARCRRWPAPSWHATPASGRPARPPHRRRRSLAARSAPCSSTTARWTDRPGFFVLTPLLLAPWRRGAGCSAAGRRATPGARAPARGAHARRRAARRRDRGRAARQALLLRLRGARTAAARISISTPMRARSASRCGRFPCDSKRMARSPTASCAAGPHRGRRPQNTMATRSSGSRSPLLLTGLYVWFQLLAPWRERRRARR
jgi:surfeit locus 1 family protein